MRTPSAYRAAIAAAAMIVSVGVLPAADYIAPAGDPSSPVENTATTNVDDFDRQDYEDPWRVSVTMPSVFFLGSAVIDHIIRQDGRLNAGDLLNQTREDVIEPGDPCHEGGVGSLVMCRE